MSGTFSLFLHPNNYKNWKPFKAPKVIQPILSSKSRERLVIDLIDVQKFREENDNYGWILTAVDHFSGCAFTKPVEYKSAEDVASALMEIFDHVGLWESIHADEGREFDNHTLHEIEEMLNMKTIHGAPYSPWEQGKVERFNQTLEKALGTSELNNLTCIQESCLVQAIEDGLMNCTMLLCLTTLQDMRQLIRYLGRSSLAMYHSSITIHQKRLLSGS